MTATQVALVTGSGKRRVGSEVADALARRGYAVAVHYRTSAAEAAETVAALRAHGVEVEAFQADLADEAAVRGMVGGVLRPVRPDRRAGELRRRSGRASGWRT